MTTQTLLKLYQKLLTQAEEANRGGNPPRLFHVSETVAQIPAPIAEEITEFLRVSKKFKDNIFSAYVLPEFVTALVCFSHKGGNNNFYLPVAGTAGTIYRHDTSMGLDGFLSPDLTLRGIDKDSPLIVTVAGDLGYGCAQRLSNVHLTVDGSVGAGFGRDSVDSDLRVTGDLQLVVPQALLNEPRFSLEGSERCHYHLGGKLVGRFGVSEEVEHLRDISDCTFTTYGHQTAETLRQALPPNQRNTIKNL